MHDEGGMFHIEYGFLHMFLKSSRQPLSSVRYFRAIYSPRQLTFEINKFYSDLKNSISGMRLQGFTSESKQLHGLSKGENSQKKFMESITGWKQRVAVAVTVLFA